MDQRNMNPQMSNKSGSHINRNLDKYMQLVTFVTGQSCVLFFECAPKTDQAPKTVDVIMLVNKTSEQLWGKHAPLGSRWNHCAHKPISNRKKCSGLVWQNCERRTYLVEFLPETSI